MFANVKLATKILLTGAIIAVVSPLPLLFWILPAQRNSGFEMKTEGTRNVIEAAYGVVEYYGKQAENGAMSLSQAQMAAMQTIRYSRYGEGNYVWINDLRPYMIMHPAKPALNGTDLSNSRDPNGLALFVEGVRVCKAHGQGTIRYLWPKPGEVKPVAKISYVKLYQPWGWVLGSGVYVDDVEAALRHTQALIFLVTGLELLGALLLCFFIARAIGNPIASAASELNKTVNQTRAAVDQVATASQTIASALSEQAASIEETSASLQELSSQTRSSAAHALRIRELMHDVDVSVQEGDRQMVKMNGAMQDIDQSAQQVSRIVKTTEEIAFQTNILALNAAVEASRAGQAGAGFSVVADEVRNLAQRASAAARETAGLIASSLESSRRGSAITGTLTSALSVIVSKIEETNVLLESITTSFEQQDMGISQISTAVDQLNNVTQAHAASSEETASAAEELRFHAESVQSLALGLRAVVEGATRESDR